LAGHKLAQDENPRKDPDINISGVGGGGGSGVFREFIITTCIVMRVLALVQLLPGKSTPHIRVQMQIYCMLNIPGIREITAIL
jgi:hypothetical protein